MAIKMKEIVRGVNGIKSVSQLRTAINEAMAGAANAIRKTRLPTDLRRSAAKLRKHRQSISTLPDLAPISTVKNVESIKRDIIGAWINVAGAKAEFTARKTVSFAKEFSDEFEKIGEKIGKGAEKAGAAAGAAAGGLLRGAPIVVVIIIVALAFKFGGKGAS